MFLRCTKVIKTSSRKFLSNYVRRWPQHPTPEFSINHRRFLATTKKISIDNDEIEFEVEDTMDSSFELPKSAASPVKDASDLLANKFGTTFDSRHPPSMYDIRQGGYVNIDPSSVQKYFPEGLAGEAMTEFELAHSKSWMVRDSTKILCRILDEFVVKNASKYTSVTPVRIEGGSLSSSRVNLAGYTDRPAMRSSIVQAQAYGTELLNTYSPLGKLRGAPPQIDSQANNLNQYMAKITEAHGGSVPTRVLLTGTGNLNFTYFPLIILIDFWSISSGQEGSGRSMCLNQAVMHARQNGWLVLFIPNAWAHSQEGPFVEPVKLDSGVRVFDNAVMSAEALRGFLKAHQAVLSKLPIRNKDALKKYKPTIDSFKVEWARALSMPGTYILQL